MTAYNPEDEDGPFRPEISRDFHREMSQAPWHTAAMAFKIFGFLLVLVVLGFFVVIGLMDPQVRPVFLVVGGIAGAWALLWVCLLLVQRHKIKMRYAKYIMTKGTKS